MNNENKKLILLLYPRFLDDVPEFPDLPLNLLCIGSYLDDKGYRVVIIDENNWDEEQFSSKIKDYLPNTICVGISIMTSQVTHALRISRFIKKINPNIEIVWGGKHATVFPEQTAENQYIDVAVKGEGEGTFYEIVKAIENNSPIDKIQGITIFKDGQFISNPMRPLLDINELPMPKYELQEILKKFTMREILQLKRFGPPIITTRGCPYRCTFCINKILKEKIRIRSADLVLGDIRSLNKQGINKVRIMDEFSFISKKRIEQIVTGIIDEKLDLKWNASIRSNCFSDNYVNDAFLREMKKSGCIELALGAESGSQRILDKIKKDIKVEDTIRAAKMLSKAGINATFSFMIGIPGETLEDIKKTLGLIYKVTKIHKGIEVLGPQLYRPYPGSDLYDEIAEYIKFPEKLEGWKEDSLIFGDVSRTPIDFPWLNVEGNDLKKLRFYGSNENGFTQPTRYRKMHYKVIEFFLKNLIRARVKYSYYNFPMEYHLYTFINNLIWNIKYKKIESSLN